MSHSKRITKNKPASPNFGSGTGTLSQFIRVYSKNGEPILMVHQFVRPDGSIGASGKPDPKMILFEGIEYFC